MKRIYAAVTELYRERISNLAAALSDPAVRLQAVEALRGLISELRMIPEQSAPGGHRIELVGELAAILALGDADMQNPARGGAGVRSGTLVAGAGFEHCFAISRAGNLPSFSLAAHPDRGNRPGTTSISAEGGKQPDGGAAQFLKHL